MDVSNVISIVVVVVVVIVVVVVVVVDSKLFSQSSVLTCSTQLEYF